MAFDPYGYGAYDPYNSGAGAAYDSGGYGDFDLRRRALMEQMRGGAASATGATDAYMAPVDPRDLRPIPGSTPPLPAGPDAPPTGTTRDQALKQMQAAYAKYGKSVTPGTEEYNDFTNIWNQSAEAGLMTGPGYGNPWETNFNAYLPRIAERWAPTASAGGRGGGADPDSGTGRGRDLPSGRDLQSGRPLGTGEAAGAFITSPDGSQSPSVSARTPGGGIDDFLRYLQSYGQRADADRMGVRQVLMDQLAQAARPVSLDDPMLSMQLDPQRLALQRSAERQRSQLAARLAAEGLLDSGAFDTGLAGIEQGRGEAEARATGNVLGQELQARRQQLQSLLAMALASNDAESARAIQAELAALQTQLGSQYNYDALGANLALQQAGLNQNAILALLGLV